jgi:hypothetical protein
MKSAAIRDESSRPFIAHFPHFKTGVSYSLYPNPYSLSLRFQQHLAGSLTGFDVDLCLRRFAERIDIFGTQLQFA